MADMSKIIATLANLLKNVPVAIEQGREVVDLAQQIYQTIGKSPNDISDADLDALAAASDDIHRQVQEPIEDDEA